MKSLCLPRQQSGTYSVSNILLRGKTIYGITINGGANGNGTVYAYTP